MADSKSGQPSATDAVNQELVGFMSNEDWDRLVATVGELLAEVENIPYPGVKEKVFALLQAIDGVHREPLRRLVHVFKEGVLEKVVTDPAIHTLMELYDLLPKGSSRDAQPTPEEAAKWRERLSRKAPPVTPSPPAPHWVPAPIDDGGLSKGQCRARTIDSREILLGRVDDHFFALDLLCAEGGASLAGATLDGYTLICPNHQGCFYDVRQGKRVGRPETLTCYPTQVDDNGRILVGFGIPFTPDLPSF